jgi:hypothetical protein
MTERAPRQSAEFIRASVNSHRAESNEVFAPTGAKISVMIRVP